MSILDKKYKLAQLDLIEKTYNQDLNMIFSLSDNETSDFYLKITKNLVNIDLSDFSVVLWIKKPDNTTISKTVQQDENGLFYCNLENKYKDQKGKYEVQAFIEDAETFERIATLSTFSYEVIDDILNQRKDQESSGQINISYDETEKAIVFDCDAIYNAQTNTVAVEVG